MNLVLTLSAGLIALILMALGLNAMFNPEGAATQFSITATGATGLNTIRGDLGGMFVAGALLIALGLVRRQPAYLVATAVLMVTIAVGRVVGLVLDGMSVGGIVAPLLELLFAVTLLTVARGLETDGLVRDEPMGDGLG